MRAEQKVLGLFRVLVLTAGVLLAAYPATGAITLSGDIDPTYDGVSAPWIIAGDLKVGQAADANMIIANGSRITDVNAFMAYGPGSTVDVLITGSTSKWTSSAGLYIGGNQTEAGGVAILNIATGTVEAGPVIIWNQGYVGGSGTLKGTTVTNWGTINPGSSTGIGTLNIEGNITFQPTSVLEVNVDNSGNSDKLAVTGNVTIVGGTVKPISTETITGNKQYTIVEGTHVTGTFGAMDTGLLHISMMDPCETLGYTDTMVLLNITASPFDLNVGRTVNQVAVATVLQDIADEGGTTITGALQQLPDLDAVRAAYDQLSGQSRPPLAPIAVTDSSKFIAIISNRLQGARGDMAMDLDGIGHGPLLAMAETNAGIGAGPSATWDTFLWDLDDRRTEDYGIWGKLYGLSADRDTANGITGYSYSTFGQMVGFDGQMGDRMIGGAMGGASSTDVEYDGLPDEATIETTRFGLYSNYSGDGWYANSAVMYSILNIDTERTVDLMGLQNEGNFDGREYSGYIEAGLDWQPAVTWLVQPVAGFQASFLHFEKYAEQARTSEASALIFQDQDYESYRATIGAKISKEVALDLVGGAAILQARGRWVHEFGDVVSTVDARFEPVPPTAEHSFTWAVSTAEDSRDSIILGAGAGIRLTRGLRLFVDYDTCFNSEKTINVISGALEYRW